MRSECPELSALSFLRFPLVESCDEVVETALSKLSLLLRLKVPLIKEQSLRIHDQKHIKIKFKAV